MPPPMAVRRWQKSAQLYVRPRTGPQYAHLWWPAVAEMQAASAPIAYAAAPCVQRAYSQAAAPWE